MPEKPPEKTAREQLAEIAHEYGWRVVDVYGLDSDTVRYKCLERVVTVVFTEDGAIKEAGHQRPGLTLRTDRDEKGKRALVDKWLRQP